MGRSKTESPSTVYSFCNSLCFSAGNTFNFTLGKYGISPFLANDEIQSQGKWKKIEKEYVAAEYHNVCVYRSII